MFAIAGNHTNLNAVLALQGGFSLFDFIFIPIGIFSKITFGIEELKVIFNPIVYQNSGFKLRQSLYVQVLSFLQYLVIVAVLQLINLAITVLLHFTLKPYEANFDLL